MTLQKKSRVVQRLPGWAVLQDITADGRTLLTRERIQGRAFVHTPDLREDRELSWLDGTNILDISRDRKLLLLTEAAAGGGPGFSTYIRPLDGAPDPAPPPVLTKGYVTFGSYNRLEKMSAPVFAAWAAILHRLPNCRLILKNVALSVPDVAENMRRRFRELGIGPGRFELRTQSPHREMLAEYADIDIALDTFPYNGGATSLDALWMGVPIIALAGERMISRQTAAMLACIGLQEFVAPSIDEYVELAVSKALESERLREIRAGLRGRMQASPLCDAPRFARDLEDNFRLVWRRWCA